MDFFVTFLYLWSKCSHIIRESDKNFLCVECSWTAELYYFVLSCPLYHVLILMYVYLTTLLSRICTYLILRPCMCVLVFVEVKKHAHSLTLLNPCNLEHLYCCEGTCIACCSQLSNMTEW